MTPRCWICGSDATRDYLPAPPHRIFRCDVCTFCFIPRESYGERDPREQYARDEVSTAEYYEGSTGYDVRNFNDLLVTIEEYEPRSSLVDVGSNIGTFPRVALDRGWKVTAVEPNPQAAAVARKRGVEVVEGLFSPEMCRGGAIPKVRVVTLNDVIEHVFDPMELLRGARESLEDGGLVVVVTPDIDTASCRRYQIKPEEHVCYFNRRSITEALGRAGFEVLLCRPAPRYRDVVNVARNPTSRLRGIDRVAVGLASIPPVGAVLARLVKLLIRDELVAIGRKKAV